jgi:signal transduction histidine kinase
MSLDTARAYRSREAALTEMSHRIHQERNDERQLIAADLHDEVVQPLFKVTLMAQVLKADLSSGKLLEIEEDLPELLGAAELASASLRELIGDLRRSRVGSAGLASAIRAFVRTACQNTTAAVDVSLDELVTDEDTELVIYHLVRESLTNALRHSRASRVSVEVRQDNAATHVSVRDDGTGFDVYAEQEGHYGIQIMRERVRSVGGDIYVDSSPGNGTLITAVFRSRSHSGM